MYNASTNAIELFGVGSDGVLNHTYNLNAGAWQGWSTMGSHRFAGAPAVVFEAGSNAADVFAIGADGVISHSYSAGGSTWSNWASLGTWKFQTT